MDTCEVEWWVCEGGVVDTCEVEWWVCEGGVVDTCEVEWWYVRVEWWIHVGWSGGWGDGVVRGGVMGICAPYSTTAYLL